MRVFNLHPLTLHLKIFLILPCSRTNVFVIFPGSCNNACNRYDTTNQCKGKNAKALLGEHNMRAVLVDTQGPEIRTGNVEGGGKIALVQGSMIELTTNPVRPNAILPSCLPALPASYRSLWLNSAIGCVFVFVSESAALTVCMTAYIPENGEIVQSAG